MWPMVVAAVAPTVFSMIGNALSSGDRDSADQAIQDAYAKLQELGVPPDYAKNIIYEQIKNVGDYKPELEKDLGELKSSFASYVENPELKNQQMDVLGRFKGLSEQGLSAMDRFKLSEVQSGLNQQNRANQEAIIQNLQSRGMAGGGAEMANRLAAQQASANLASSQGMNIAAQSQEASRNALKNWGDMAGTVRATDLQKDTNRLNAQDVAARYSMDNSVNRQMRNVASTNQGNLFNIQKNQGIENSNVGIRNQQVSDRNQAEQTRYNQGLARAGAYMGGGQAMANQYNQNANRTANQWGQAGQGFGQLAAGYGQYKNNQELMDSRKPLQDAQTNYYNSLSKRPNSQYDEESFSNYNVRGV